MQVYVLTRDINEYNQDGMYFVKVFANMPTLEQLEAAGVPIDQAKCLVRGEEYQKYAYECFYLNAEEI